MPLIHEVVPLLEDVAARLEMMSQGLRPDNKPVSKVIRLAAQAALVVCRKYEALGQECEVYEIAMGMYFMLISSNLALITIFRYYSYVSAVET